MTQLESDKALISDLGGPAKLAERLGVSIQVVSNWNARGIPPKVKVKHPDLFLPHLRDRRQQPRTAATR